MPDQISACRSCGAPIRWVRTTYGRLVPIDPDPVSNGNIVIQPISGTADYVRKGAYIDQTWDRYVSHFVTCPDADAWRKPRARR